MEFVAIEHLLSIHSLDIFFLWWWGHTSDKSPLNQIPGSLPGYVKRNSSGKTTTKPLTNMDERCFHRLCGGLASYSRPPSFTKGLVRVSWVPRELFAVKPPQLLSLWQTSSRKTTIIFLTTVHLLLGFYFLFVVSLFFSSVFPERCTRQMKEHRSQSDELV